MDSKQFNTDFLEARLRATTAEEVHKQAEIAAIDAWHAYNELLIPYLNEHVGKKLKISYRGSKARLDKCGFVEVFEPCTMSYTGTLTNVTGDYCHLVSNNLPEKDIHLKTIENIEVL